MQQINGLMDSWMLFKHSLSQMLASYAGIAVDRLNASAWLKRIFDENVIGSPFPHSFMVLFFFGNFIYFLIDFDMDVR